MIGNNQLNLNQATVIEAMQEYLNKRMGIYAPKVTGVSFSRSGHDETFHVHVEKDASNPAVPIAVLPSVWTAPLPTVGHGQTTSVDCGCPTNHVCMNVVCPRQVHITSCSALGKRGAE